MLRNTPRHVLLILLLAGCARLLFAFTFVDLRSTFYWEYGEIARNILAGRGYSLWYFVGDELQLLFNPAVTPFPSAYMSPGYVAFLLPFLLIGQDVVRNVALILVQTLLSLLSMLLLYRLTVRIFSEKAATLATVLAGFLPDFVYTTVSFTPTILFHCCVIALMIVLTDAAAIPVPKRVILLSILLVALCYLRFEVLLFVGFVLLLRLTAGRWKEVVAVTAVVIVLLSPWVIRNSLALGEFVPTGTGFGLNLFRGNNPDEIGSWRPGEIPQKIAALPRDRSFEAALNRMYVAEVVSYVREQPGRVLRDLPVKFYDLWVYSPVGNKAPLISLVTSWLLLFFFVIGFFSTLSWRKYKYLYLFLLFSTIIALIFFTLPRHQTMMRIAVLPFAAAGLEVLWQKVRGKQKSEVPARRN